GGAPTGPGLLAGAEPESRPAASGNRRIGVRACPPGRGGTLRWIHGCRHLGNDGAKRSVGAGTCAGSFSPKPGRPAPTVPEALDLYPSGKGHVVDDPGSRRIGRTGSA